MSQQTRTGAQRHPEKQKNPDTYSGKKPEWIKVRAGNHPIYFETKEIVKSKNLVTVCEEAACPNIGECWAKRHATFMILGSICTRACAFCNVATGKPFAPDPFEAYKVADSVAEMGLLHTVITSVDRDDLADGGASAFVDVINAIRERSPASTIEILTPDFRDKGQSDAIESIVAAKPDVFNHNLETVPSLYPTIRPGARYFTSLELLHRVKQIDGDMFTKSGIMVGLGETKQEISQVMDDLRAANVDFITVGQYLQPTPKHAPIDRFVTPDEFAELEKIAYAKGFLMVSCTPLTRSSHHAGDDFKKLQTARQKIMIDKKLQASSVAGDISAKPSAHTVS